MPSPRACRPLRKGSIVHVLDLKTTKINVGGGVLGVGDVIVDTNGENIPAPPDYPFPGLHKNSFIIRLGTQVVQGGSDFTFTAGSNGDMEFCVNDKQVNDNSGAWGLNIEVSEPED